MGFYSYILYSRSLDEYYIGETEDVKARLQLHNSGFFKGSYTSKSSGWVIFFLIKCTSRNQARMIERHIKNMKSRKYIENLKTYPKISKKLLEKYQ
jgi:putative endonuclease